MINPRSERQIDRMREANEAAKTLGLELVPVDVNLLREHSPALEIYRAARVQAVLGLPDDDLFRLFLGTIVSAANELRIPSFFDTSDVIDTGATMSYGPDSFDAFRRSASYIDKLAKGAKAAELPVEQPVKVEFVINAKRAAEFGLKIPREALLRADVVVR